MTDKKTENKKSEVETKLTENVEKSRVIDSSGNPGTIITANRPESLTAQLADATKDLFYISETDAPFEIFVWEREAGAEAFSSVNAAEILRFTENASEAALQEQSLADFFRFPTTEQDWQSDEDKEIVKRYLKLKELIEQNLRDAKVFKIGEVEIDVYVVGINADGDLAGVKTKATET